MECHELKHAIYNTHKRYVWLT